MGTAYIGPAPSITSTFRQKLLLVLLGAVVGASLTFVAGLLLGYIQSQKPDLYYVIKPALTADFEGGSQTMGTIVLGNDGNASEGTWKAELTFAEGASIHGIVARLGERVLKMTPGKTPNVMCLTPVDDVLETLHENKTIEIQYSVDKEQKPEVVFGSKQTAAEEREPKSSDNTTWGLKLLVVICAAIAVIGLRDKLIVWLDPEKAAFKKFKIEVRQEIKRQADEAREAAK